MPVTATIYSGEEPGQLGTPPAQTGPSVIGTLIVAPSPIPECGEPPVCQDDCAWIFDRIVVMPMIDGGTRVEWVLHPQFRDPAPYGFQLQVGRTANPEADDWANVGLPQSNSFYAIDDTKRVWAATQWTHYRVKMVTPTATYFSKPQSAIGGLDRADWLAWRAHLRTQSLNLRKAPNGVEGYVLKRRLYGEPCDCLDPGTGEVRKPQHERCYGTGWVGGYFSPMGCQYAAMELRMTRDTIDDAMRGMVNNGFVPSTILAVPQLYENDVFVEKHTDVRYAVRGLQYKVAHRNIPIVYAVKFVPYPFDHVIYKFPLS